MWEAEHQDYPGDFEAQGSQGPVTLHSEEHLFGSDKGVINVAKDDAKADRRCNGRQRSCWRCLQRSRRADSHRLGKLSRKRTVAIRDASRRLGTRDLSGCVMYLTFQPCPMCQTAAYWAKVSQLYHGSGPADGGAPRYGGC